MNRFFLFLFAAAISVVVSEPLLAQGGPGQGRGFRGGRGPGFQGGRGPGFQGGRGPGFQGGRGPGFQGGPGHGHDDRHDADHEVFQFLLTHHKQIQRTVKELANGVETLTESDNPEIASKIKEHVEWMQYRIEKNHPIRMRDPLFAELFQHTDKIKIEHEDTEKGVRVTETSEDPFVAKLIKEHAKVVSGFVQRGFAEAMKNHAIPGQPNGSKAVATHPTIKGHGAVVQLPTASQQPRSGTKLLVDVTRGSDPAELNAAIERVAKYVNLYAGGGAEPADVQIAVVFHGDATLTVLNSDAYAAAFETDANPNLDLLHQLHEAGVELYVCGQSLLSKGSSPEEVAVFVDTAVSALTAVVNLQADGYAYLPLGK